MLRKYQWRFFLLTLIMTAPIYYLYYFPVLFKKSIEFEFLDYYTPSHLEFLFHALFIFYVFPNIFLFIFKKELFEVLTLRRILFISSTLLFVGQLFLELGISQKLIHLMIFSRSLYGLGTEALFSILKLLLLKYFTKEHLNLVFAVLMMSCNLFGAFSFPVSGYLFRFYDIYSIFKLNRLLISISYLFALITVSYDLYIERNTVQINVLLENYRKKKKEDKVWLIDMYVSKDSLKNANKINYLLYFFAIFYVPNIICFNNFGSSYLLERFFPNMALKQGFFNVSVIFCGLWVMSTLSSSLMTLYLQRNSRKFAFYKEEKLVYCTFLAILGHLLLLFYSPVAGALCLGVSYGSTHNIFMGLLEKYLQKEDYILCVVNLSIIILSYFLAFITLSGPFYSLCEIVLLSCAILSFIIAVKVFHVKQFATNQKKNKRNNEENTGFHTTLSRNSVNSHISVEMEKFK